MKQGRECKKEDYRETSTTPSSVQNFWCDFCPPVTLCPVPDLPPNTGPQFPLRMVRRLGRDGISRLLKACFLDLYLQVSERVPLPMPSLQPE